LSFKYVEDAGHLSHHKQKIIRLFKERKNPLCYSGFWRGVKIIYRVDSIIIRMKWKTHRAIARAIAAEAALNREETRSLLEGIISPDKYPEKTFKIKMSRRGNIYAKEERISHHNPSLNIIMKHVWKSRFAFLSGNTAHAAFWAGWALHYIQDRCVGKGLFNLYHKMVEESAAHIQISRENVQYGFKHGKSSPSLIRKMLKNLKPTTDPKKAVNEAVFYSAAVFAAIFGPRKLPTSLMEKYNHKKKNHEKLLAGIGVAIAAAFASMFLGNLPFAALATILAGIIYYADGEYRMIREEVQWFIPD